MFLSSALLSHELYSGNPEVSIVDKIYQPETACKTRCKSFPPLSFNIDRSNVVFRLQIFCVFVRRSVFFVCVLRFYGPGNPKGSCRAGQFT